MRFRQTVYTLLVFLCPGFSFFAQQPLSVGDSVPDFTFENLWNHSSSKTKLSAFKDKMVILDFWATWCTACIQAIPKMDSLQTAFENKLQILMVNTSSTNDDLLKIETFYKKWESKAGRKLLLPTLVSDTVADKLFPHLYIPHYVWISKERKVMAVSSAEAVTADNIRAALNGEPPGFAMKKDQDTRRPLFSTADLPSGQLLNYSVFLKGWFDGLGSGSSNRLEDGVVCGKAFTNTSILNMYKAIAREMEPGIREGQVMVKIADSSELFPPSSSRERELWYGRHSYTLDLLVPVSMSGQLHSRMLEALNFYSGYTGRFETTKQKSWVLKTNGSTAGLKSKGGRTENKLWDSLFLENGSMKMLVNYLNNLHVTERLIIDETAYLPNIDITFSEKPLTIKQIREQLEPYGLALWPMEKMVKVFVIRKK